MSNFRNQNASSVVELGLEVASWSHSQLVRLL